MLLIWLRNLIILLLIITLLFLGIGPQLPIPTIKTASLKARSQTLEFLQDKVIDPLQTQWDKLKNFERPMPTMYDQRHDLYTEAVQEVIGEEASSETCLALFGMIPIKCPDQVSNEDCAQLFGLTPLQCQRILNR